MEPPERQADLAEIRRREDEATTRELAANRREQESDVREGVLDRWERELTTQAISLGLLDEDAERSRDEDRDRRVRQHRLRRSDAEARHEAEIERGIERARRQAPPPEVLAGLIDESGH